MFRSAVCGPAPATPQTSVGSGLYCGGQTEDLQCWSMCSAQPYMTSEEESPTVTPPSDTPPSPPPPYSPITTS